MRAVSAAAWVVVEAATAVVGVVLTALLLALATAVAMAVPARRGGSLNAVLAQAGLDGSRRGAWQAYRTWRGSFLPTSGGWRRVQILLGVATMPAIVASTRWRRRSALLTGPGACLRVVRRRDGSWKLLDVAGWPVGAGRGRPLLERVCAAADAAGVTLHLRAATPKVAEAVYAPLGFQPVDKRLQMVRAPRQLETTEAAGARN